MADRRIAQAPSPPARPPAPMGRLHIDAYARRIVGWRVSRSVTAGFGLDALEQAIHERLAEAGIAPSVGSVGDSFDDALAETVIGLFKTEVTRRRGPWRSLEAVEFATLEWVD